MPIVALKNLFEKPGEPITNGIARCPATCRPILNSDRPLNQPTRFDERFRKAQGVREGLRAEVIALQEEMDWLVYAAYGLLPSSGVRQLAAAVDSASLLAEDEITSLTPPQQAAAQESGSKLPHSIEPLDREERPFRLWAHAEGDHAKAIRLIPCGWPGWRKKLWEARLGAIRESEHIRRIEQPVYKRRWDEQWKVGNQWRCGPVAYAAEFVDAFEWWLREKAEWFVENKKRGGPAEIGEWTASLWSDPRVQAAWPVATENYALLEYEKAKEKARPTVSPLRRPALRPGTQ